MAPPGTQWSVPPGYGAPYGVAPANAMNQLCLISMILGITAAASTMCCGLVAVPAGLAGVTTGIIGLSQLRSGTVQQGRGQAVAGIACGAAALVLQIALIILQIGRFSFAGLQS